MFVKQIGLKEALGMAGKGQEVKVLVPPPDGDWKDMLPTTLQAMLDGCLFFRAEPAMEDAGFAAAVQEMGAAAAAEAGGAKKPVGSKKVDVGKILALHDAKWSNAEIARELKMNEKSVWYHINKARKGQKDAENKDIPSAACGGKDPCVG